MQAPFQAERGSAKRRSYRFSHRVPVILSSTNSTPEFYERCETTDVSSHGCRVRSQRKLSPGQMVHLQTPHGKRQVEARVAQVRPDASATAWEVGLELVEPSNIWGLEFSSHTLHWPADLPLPPVPTGVGKAAPGEAPPPPRRKQPEAERTAAPSAPVDVPAQLDQFRRLQEQQTREFEARMQQALRAATDQMTKNAQFALNTIEASVRELAESARRDLEDWLAHQRAGLEPLVRHRRETPGGARPDESLEQLRRLFQQTLTQELEGFRARMEEAMEARLQTLAGFFGKGKKS